MQIWQHYHLLDMQQMTYYNAKVKCFEIENKEYKLNLCCENKFAYMVFLSKTNGVYKI